MQSRRKSCRVKSSALETLYHIYNDRIFAHPDPLELLYRYDDVRDREIAGLIAASLAYGRVEIILKKTTQILNIMSDSPYRFIHTTSPNHIHALCFKFKHRGVTDDEMAKFLINIKKTILDYGSLNKCFCACMSNSDKTILTALCKFARIVGHNTPHLVPDPSKGSACKRLNLYLRWMVRHDKIDPGGWDGISPAILIVPVDVHMARVARLLGLTSRKTPDIAMALEITQNLKLFDKHDPVKYDFALTRYGIRKDCSLKNLLNELTKSR